jgi:regulator of replication initiation timing
MMLYEMGGGGAMARELGEMAKKQRELEGVIKNLVNDNQNLREENAKLSKRIEKNLEKSDKKI